MKQWKLSPMDLKSRVLWEEYTRAKEEMFSRTNIREAPWWIVEANDKKRARLNTIVHLLRSVPLRRGSAPAGGRCRIASSTPTMSAASSPPNFTCRRSTDAPPRKRRRQRDRRRPFRRAAAPVAHRSPQRIDGKRRRADQTGETYRTQGRRAGVARGGEHRRQQRRAGPGARGADEAGAPVRRGGEPARAAHPAAPRLRFGHMQPGAERHGEPPVAGDQKP